VGGDLNVITGDSLPVIMKNIVAEDANFVVCSLTPGFCDDAIRRR
jgi:hypothetical protein